MADSNTNKSFDRQQQELWQGLKNDLLYAELCNALYERELPRLASDTLLSNSKRCKWMLSLPYYVRRAAQNIVDADLPLDFDSQNGSWFAKPAAHAPKQSDSDIAEFYRSHQDLLALIVPVYVFDNGYERFELDTIDQIDRKHFTVHTNVHGWFHFSGKSISQDESEHDVAHHYGVKPKPINALHYHTQLVKPVKAALRAACCGHQWLNEKRKDPRLLSLREMLLATQINWKQPNKRLPAKKSS